MTKISDKQEAQIEELLAAMTPAEKVRQLDIYSGSEFRPDLSDFAALCREAAPGGLQCLQLRDTTPGPCETGRMARINNELQRINLREARLPIPILFSEEALHGLIWPGCTVFPQQIALAATFEPELARLSGKAIGAECRSLGIHEVWAPVLDLARDPRWGRVEEGYGEDSFLAARFAGQMVSGLQAAQEGQGGVVCEVKHFSGYGAPCGGLNCAPAMLGRHEHAMYCLPVFEAAFRAGAPNAMCSYNSIDGLPVAADHSLLSGTLRDQLGMQGFVRSDMTAIAMLHSCHFVAESRKEAIRQALNAGVDVQLYDFPHDFYQQSLLELLHSGGISAETLDNAVRRVLRVKMLAGLFEQPFVDEDASQHVVHCPKHRQLAQEVAEKAICLLRNRNATLPLARPLRSLAVIGPSAAAVRWGDYSPTPAEGSKAEAGTLLNGLRELLGPQCEVRYAQGCSILEQDFVPLPANWLWHEGQPGLLGRYVNGHDLSVEPVLERRDTLLQFQWIFSKVGEGVDDSCFGVRWCGQLRPDRRLEASLRLSGRDSAAIYLDSQLIFERRDGRQSHCREVRLEAGGNYELVIELINDERAPRVSLGFSNSKSEDLEEQAVQILPGAEALILAMGDDEQSCGENFDRSDLNLPGRQGTLLRRMYREAKALGIPVILVLQHGRPLSLEWEDQHLDAILSAWFAGERAGQALARVLLGEVNPAGRLPLSFPRSVGQLPVHYNRRPFGSHKYVEMDWQPLYPFGYGLSYTSFEYEDMRLSQAEGSLAELRAGKIFVTLNLSNTGDCHGEEVVQLYLHDRFSSVVRPYRELCGFCRVGLAPGECSSLVLPLGEESLRLLDRNFCWIVEPGEFDLMLGPNSADIRLRDTFVLR